VRPGFVSVTASVAIHAGFLGVALLIAGAIAPSPQVIFLELTEIEQPAAPTPPRPTQRPTVPMADEVFKNVQVLKGISVAEFMDTMGFFSAAVGSNCVHCHVDESLTHWDKFAEDVPRKRRARQMILMMKAINRTNFGGTPIDVIPLSESAGTFLIHSANPLSRCKPTEQGAMLTAVWRRAGHFHGDITIRREEEALWLHSCSRACYFHARAMGRYLCNPDHAASCNKRSC